MVFENLFAADMQGLGQFGVKCLLSPLGGRNKK